MRRFVVLPITLALLVPAGATADTLDTGPNDGFRAVTINTPGQSGHVSVLDLAAQTAGEDVPPGPHMLDQLPLYSDLRYKPGNFQPTGIPDAVLPGARVYRDAHGVPAVYGDTLEAAWFGVGYAIAEDRMWQQHLLRMVAWGRSAELIGRDGLSMDRQARRDYYTHAEYVAFFASLEPWEQAVMIAYAAGVNAYIAEMHANPAKMPAEIAALGLPIEPWSPLDSLALGALMARSVASDGGQEASNATLLANLIDSHGETDGAEIFDDLLWANDPGAPTSVPAEDGEFPSYPHGEVSANALAKSAAVALPLADSLRSVAQVLEAERALRERLRRTLGLPRPGSDMWVVSPDRSTNGSTFLFDGPQVGYTVAGLLVEFEIHGGDATRRMDARGITVAGVPVVGIGYTPRHAWGLTSGLSDTIDLYVETLVGDARHYLHNGETLEMDCRTEVIVVKSTLEIADGTPPTVETQEVCRTIHGPVIAIDEQAGVAYAQRYAVWGRELGTLKGLLRFATATSFEEFSEAMSMVTWNENTTYADVDGTIAYWHPGLYPARPLDFDERLPYPGTGEAEWERLLTFEEMPHVMNPARGWVANWNSKPSAAWTNGDPHYSDRPWGEANRLDAIHGVLAGSEPIGAIPAGDVTGLVDGWDGIFAPDVRAGLYDLTVDYFRPLLADARDDGDDRQKDAIDLIVDWDGNHQDGDGNGLVDHAGLTIFDHWIRNAPRAVFGPSLISIGGFDRGGHRFEPSPRINLFLRALKGDDAPLAMSRDYLAPRTAAETILDTLDATLDALEAQFGAQQMEGWLKAAERSSLETQGLGPGGRIPYQDRGSYIQVIEYLA